MSLTKLFLYLNIGIYLLGLSSLPLSAPESSPAQASGSQGGGPPVSSTETGGSQPPVSQPQYKMEPMDTSMYYGGPESGDPHNPASSVFQVSLIFLKVKLFYSYGWSIRP